MSEYFKVKKFISYLESNGFINTTKPEYVVESFDEIPTSREIDPEWYCLEKKWMKVLISNDNECYIKCTAKDTTVVPYIEKEYCGYLESYKDNYISLKYKGIEIFGSKDEIPTTIKTSSVYTISLPK